MSASPIRGLGTALVERSMLETLMQLWEGPVNPWQLDRIEVTLRAFILCPTLAASQFYGPWKDVLEGVTLETRWEEPFGDGLLDYEFQHPGIPIARGNLQSSENAFLREKVRSALVEEAKSRLPDWIRKTGQAFAFWDAWYQGEPQTTCEVMARRQRGWEDENKMFDRGAPFSPHWIHHHGPEAHAQYLVECHRAGVHVYGDSPIIRICNEHLFSLWPHKLFESFDEEYRRATRELRGPGIAVELPSVTAILLSRSPSRGAIPEALRDLRAEYDRPRRELWDLLGEMWSAPTLSRQMRILRKLRGAAAGLFASAFRERVDILSVGLL